MTETKKKIVAPKDKIETKKKKTGSDEAVSAAETASPESNLPLREATLAQAKKLKIVIPPGLKYYGTGRRKEAVAKVWLAAGTGQITVNAKNSHDYFSGRQLLEYQINRPFETTKTVGRYDVFAEVFGGGIPGQAGAVTLGIARALIVLNPDFKVALKREGLMTRDPRMKERKKYGRKRARKRFQYSKR